MKKFLKIAVVILAVVFAGIVVSKNATQAHAWNYNTWYCNPIPASYTSPFGDKFSIQSCIDFGSDGYVYGKYTITRDVKKISLVCFGYVYMNKPSGKQPYGDIYGHTSYCPSVGSKLIIWSVRQHEYAGRTYKGEMDSIFWWGNSSDNPTFYTPSLTY